MDALESRSITEDRNLKIVEDFCDNLGDPDVLAAFFAPDAYIKPAEDHPAIIGADAMVSLFKTVMAPGTRVDVETHSTFACGPVVVTDRTDVVRVPEQPDMVIRLIGVWFLKNGKIVEWMDYVHATDETEEGRNRDLIAGYCDNLDDLQRVLSILAPNATVRYSEQMDRLEGHQAVTDAFQSMMPSGGKIAVDTSRTYSAGPVVANVRRDVATIPGQPDQTFDVVGVFVVKEGAIVEWTDYDDSL